jgi:hypothetical protein
MYLIGHKMILSGRQAPYYTSQLSQENQALSVPRSFVCHPWH